MATTKEILPIEDVGTVMWAIYLPWRGAGYFNYVDHTRTDAIGHITGDWMCTWKSLYRKGFRCVRVKIVQEGQDNG